MAHKHGVIYQGKYQKQAIKINWKEIEYHVQNGADVAHKDVKCFAIKTSFRKFPFCGLYTKPHGVRGLSKYYYMMFDPKLVHGIF